MYLVALALAEGFLYYMPAVRGCINDRIIRLCRGAALKGGLEHTEIIIALVKGKIINKYDKLKRPYAKGWNKRRS